MAYENTERNIYQAFSHSVAELQLFNQKNKCKFLVFFCFGDQNVRIQSPLSANQLNLHGNNLAAPGRDKGGKQKTSLIFDKIAEKSKMEEEEFRNALDVCEKSFVHFLFITSSLEQIKGEKMLKLVKTAKRSKLIELSRTKMTNDKKESSINQIVEFF